LGLSLGLSFSVYGLALWYSPYLMTDFSFYLFRLPNAPENGDRFFVVKVTTADAQGRTRENRLKKDWATTKFTDFVAWTLKSASSAKLIAEIGSNTFLKMKTSVASCLNDDEVIYEVKAPYR
jgi:hypothetical protein